MRFLRLFLGILIAWLCVTPVASGATLPDPPVTAHAYDSQRHSVVVTSTNTERGPPSAYDDTDAYGAVDRWSRGASTRPRAAASSAAYAYDGNLALVQVDCNPIASIVPVQAIDGDLLSLQRWHVAANAGGRVALDLLRLGDLKLPAVPKGAVETPTQTGKGMEYVIPRGTPEISEKVASVRIMDPVTAGKSQYPNGFAVYMNSSGQTINPLTGQTIARTNPYAHIPLP